MMKKCTLCNIEKKQTSFYKGWDRCRACGFGVYDPISKAKKEKERVQKWQIENQERFRLGQLLGRAKHRAKKLNIPFDLTPEDIVIPEICPVLGIKLSHKRIDGWQSFPSLDRIEPAKGYVRGNVIVVSWLANTIKSCATPDQILAVGEFYKNLK